LAKQVSPKSSQRVSTGVSGLDSLLDGGFLPGRCYLVAGDAGTAKTTLCIQFLLAGLQQDEKAVYVAVDERPAEILQSFSTLELDLQGYIDDKKLAILDASAYFSARAGMGDKAMDLAKIVSDLAAHANRVGATRLAIDPVTPLILSGDSRSRVQDQARSLIHLLQSQLTTTNLFTSHLPSRGSDDATGGIEEFLAAGVIVLRLNQVGDRFFRTLSIKKMRGTPVNPSEHPFTIVKGSGVVITAQDGTPATLDDGSFQALEVFQLPKEEN
jgi:circadian clock protein KaiC